MTSTEYLSPVALDFLWESVGAGELPYPLESRSHGATMDERGTLRRRVLGERPATDDLEDALTTLAMADRSVDAVFLPEPGARRTAAIAAAVGDRALLAVQNDGGLWLRPIDPVSLVSSVVGLLPVVRRGTEPSVTMPSAELDAGGRTRDDREVLRRLGEQRRLRVGQFAANARRLGGRARSSVLTWFDTEAGRYLTYATRDWVTVAPADAAALRHRLTEMSTSLVH